MTRAARADELPKLWPAVRSAYVMPDFDALTAFHAQGPWRVRVSDEGDAMLLSRWRVHLDVLAITGLWAPGARTPGLVSDARAVARSQGLRRVLSPLVDEVRAVSFGEAGMKELARLTAYTLPQGGLRSGRPPGSVVVRPARSDDVDALVELEAGCFDDFWRHGDAEISEALAADHVGVVEDEAGGIAGYAVSARSGSVVTVGRLATREGQRRRGVASALLSDADAWAGRLGARGLSLCTQAHNSAARALYRGAGFTEVVGDFHLLISEA